MNSNTKQCIRIPVILNSASSSSNFLLDNFFSTLPQHEMMPNAYFIIDYYLLFSFFFFFFLITELLPGKIDCDGGYNVVAACQIIIFTSEGLCLWSSDEKKKH